MQRAVCALGCIGIDHLVDILRLGGGVDFSGKDGLLCQFPGFFDAVVVEVGKGTGV